MKLLKGVPAPNKSDKRMLLVSASIFLATCVFVAFAASRNTSIPADNSTGTLNSGIVLPVGSDPKATPFPTPPPLTSETADQIRAVQQMVSDCPDYAQSRRDQMNQHIMWLLQPSTLPQTMYVALGTNTSGRLIVGMATYTLAEWGLQAKAPTSCLLPIGKKLNDLLVATSEARFSEFDG